MTTTDESWTSWLCDLEEPEDHNNFVNESNTKGVDDVASAPKEENFLKSFSTSSNGSYRTPKTEHSSTMSNSSGDDNSFDERPIKTLKIGTTSPEYFPQKKESSLSYILSFDNANQAPILSIDSSFKPKAKVNVNNERSIPLKGSLENQKKEPRNRSNNQENKNPASFTRSPRHAQDHIVAERRRRENISQQFIALSALIPDLKKMDKASVLGEAIKHVKRLQEQVKVLEEKSKRKRTESVVYIEKSKMCSDEDVSDTSSISGDGNSYDPSKTNASMPEVEARVLERNVLIRIHCEKQKGVLMHILKEIENLHLTVINSSTLLFGNSKLDITIVAEMDDGFSLSVKEVARNVRVGIFQLM
ncbi:hypothetical protein RJT34_05611 [Clitoria ternatea]|uniref:BHLH domain-containing protein n=1 Tax=Clitoria ternatea TaxID=43366 RepID=A0AAN9PTS5_CLITE